VHVQAMALLDRYVVKTVKLKQLEIMPKEKTYKVLGHFLLEDYNDNKSSLILRLNESSGYISYRLYMGHGSSGMGEALSNLQCVKSIGGRREDALPYEKVRADETMDEFKQRVIEAIDKYSVRKFVRERKTVKF